MSSTSAQQAMLAALSPLVSGHVYPQIAPDQLPPPYIVYQDVASAPENTLNDGIAIENDRFQVDVFALDYISAHDLADAARVAMLGIAAPIKVVYLTQSGVFEPDLKLHRVMQEFSVWQPRRS
jgi:hypothetical protein